MSRKILLPGFMAVLFLGCPERPELDFLSPRVLSVDPNGPIVPIDATFTIRFSEPLNPNTVRGDPRIEDEDPGPTVVLVVRDALSDAFLTDLASDGVDASSRQDELLPVDVSLVNDNDEIVVEPRAPLARGTVFTLALSAEVRDANGNPLVDGAGDKANFLIHVETDDGPPRVVGSDFEGNALIPLNRKRFGVLFDQPVLGLTTDTFRMVGPSAPTTESIEISPNRQRVTLVLEDNPLACELFPANTEFALEVGPGITDDEGNEAAPEALSFTTSVACDETPLRIASGPFATPGEVSATVSWTTDEPSSTELRFGLSGGTLDCLGQPCPVLGAFANNAVDGRFAHSVEVSGLDVNSLYAFEVRSVDFEGFTVSAAGEFLTAPLPDIAINEIMADSPSFVEEDDEGEYIELANYGDVELDINGWAIRIDDDDPCAIPDGTPAVPAGGYLLLVRDAFLVGAYGIDEADVVRFGSTYCGKSLVNAGPDQVLLLDDDGRPISAYSGFLEPDNGRSIERTSPDAADVTGSYCLSPTGGTPAEANGALVSGCAE
jgi:hypothetical protein